MPQTSVCASAPGKVILFGEHAVVFGEPAVAAALSDLRITVKISPTSSGKVHVQMPDLPRPVEIFLDSKTICLESLREPPTKDDAETIHTMLHRHDPLLCEMSVSALTPLIYLMNRLAPSRMILGLKIQVRSQDLPVGAGLGSSAAFGVACTAALLRLSLSELPPLGRPSNEHLETINTYSFYSEILLHGTPSGIDNAVSTYGGAIDYTKEKDGSATMDKFEMPELNMIMANTHVPRSTKTLVAGVRTMFEQHPQVVGSILGCMGNIARNFRQLGSFQANDLLRLVRTNQHMLQAVGVSHPSIDLICSVVDNVSQGEAAAKLTGAGGGGCAMIVLKPGDQSAEIARKIQRALTRRRHLWRFSCLQSSVGQDGVLWIDPEEFPEKYRWAVPSLRLTNSTNGILICIAGGIALTTMLLAKR